MRLPLVATTPGVCLWLGVAEDRCPAGVLPFRAGVTTAYLSRSSYSSRRLVETELPRLSEGTSGEEDPELLLLRISDAILKIALFSLRMRISAMAGAGNTFLAGLEEHGESVC